MFSGKSLWDILQAGGITMYVLLFSSVLSISIILERYIYYRRAVRIKRLEFIKNIRRELEKGTIKRALEICNESDVPISHVVHSGIDLHGHSEKEIARAMEREIAVETTKMERHTSIIGTIGSTAVYIGLFGTVLGIIRAFKDISINRAAGINIVIGGISEALICTAAGLMVAVPAVIAHNYFVKKIDNLITDMELCASETADILAAKQK
jgi:biopolymer transport protein ExbB